MTAVPLAASLTGWPLAAATIGLGFVLGFVVASAAIAPEVRALERRLGLARRALSRIGAGRAPDPATVALEALATDAELDDEETVHAR